MPKQNQEKHYSEKNLTSMAIAQLFICSFHRPAWLQINHIPKLTFQAVGHLHNPPAGHLAAAVREKHCASSIQAFHSAYFQAARRVNQLPRCHLHCDCLPEGHQQHTHTQYFRDGAIPALTLRKTRHVTWSGLHRGNVVTWVMSCSTHATTAWYCIQRTPFKLIQEWRVCIRFTCHKIQKKLETGAPKEWSNHQCDQHQNLLCTVLTCIWPQ